MRPIFCDAVAKDGMKPVPRRGINVKSVTITAAVAAAPAIIGTHLIDIFDRRKPVSAVVNHNKKDNNQATRPSKIMNCVWKIKTEPAKKMVGHNPAGDNRFSAR